MHIPRIKSAKALLLFVLTLFTITANAQPGKIDSLARLLKTTGADTNRINIMMRLGNQFQNIDPDTAIYFHTQCIQLADQLNIPLRKCKAMVMTASDYLMKGENEKAVQLFDETLILAKKLNAKQVEGKVYSDLANIYKRQTDFPKAIGYLKKSITIFEELGIKMGVLVNLGNMGSIYNAQADYPKAIECYNKVMKMQEELGDKSQMGVTLGNIGNVYRAQGNYPKAVDYFLQALRMDEGQGNKAGVARHYGNIGSVYQAQGDQVKALDYYLRSLKMNEELGLKPSIASNLGNIGLVYFSRKDYPAALNYYEEALKINEELGDKQEILMNLSNMSTVYREQGDLERSLATQLRVIGVAEQLQLKSLLASTLANVGSNYMKLKKYHEAKAYLERALLLSKEIGAMQEVMDISRILYNLYEATSDHKAALDHFKEYVVYRDSIINKENTKKQLEQEMQYTFDKKEALAQAEQARKDALAKEELGNQRMQRNGFIAGFALMLALAAVIYRNFRNKSSANTIITRQKQEVEQQKEITEKQKLLVEEKNKEIMDSIAYARRLQLAILPPEKFVKELLPGSFILYKPKDIVAGDFYWLEKINDLILFAAADCTGHGVPGAMVSVVCSNALNRAVKEFGLREPGKILDKVRELVVETFEKSESEVKDGMDIALCALKKHSSGSTLSYSGANNPLWIARKNKEDGSFEMLETRADKQPIGKHPDSRPFTTTHVELQQGDTIYIFTDGYSDQFGGEAGKKLKAANYKKLLLSLQEESMSRQSELVDDYFERWKGSLEQVDDVCMIGVRI